MNHSLFRTYFTEGIPDTYYEGETWITLDGQNKFFCPLPCTLEIHETAEFGGVTSTNNWLYLLAQVDGQDVPNNGAASEVPSDYGWMEAFTDQTVALEPGSHTVQSFAGTDDGAVLWSFYNSYRVYIP